MIYVPCLSPVYEEDAIPKASLVYFHHEITDIVVLYFHVCTYNTDIHIYLFLFYSDSLIANYLTFMNYKIIFIILIMDTHGYLKKYSKNCNGIG